MGAILAHHLTTQNTAAARNGLGDGLGGEIISDATLLFGGGGVDQPHQQEERHHRGHEVGIGDFPGAAVMTAMPAFFDSLDDDRVVASHVVPPSKYYPAWPCDLYAAAPNLWRSCTTRL